MNKLKTLTLAAIVVSTAVVGCSTISSKESSSRSGNKLWAQNCARCHNSRSPSEMSPAQWDVVMLHMRVRAGLTARDTAAIREFLQSSN